MQTTPLTELEKVHIASEYLTETEVEDYLTRFRTRDYVDWLQRVLEVVSEGFYESKSQLTYDQVVNRIQELVADRLSDIEADWAENPAKCPEYYTYLTFTEQGLQSHPWGPLFEDVQKVMLAHPYWIWHIQRSIRHAGEDVLSAACYELLRHGEIETSRLRQTLVRTLEEQSRLLVARLPKP